MIVHNTSAANMNELLIALRDFLDANGWTINVDGTGSGGTSLTLSNGNAHKFYLTSSTVARVDYDTGAFTDRYLHAAFDRSNIGLSAVSSGSALSNDFQGPFPNVWFFTDDDATYCWIVAQSSAARYTHMGFGNLDNKGMHSVDLPFVCGMYWFYWRNIENYQNNTGNPYNYPSSDSHAIGLFGESTNQARFGIPDGLLDPGLDFTDGAIENPSYERLCSR
jgi:hypothetical protein